MRVREIVIHNFRSVSTDCTLKVDNAVTSLVGANQSGKTNVLQAISKFSAGDYQQEDICDFSSAGRIVPLDPNMSMITVTFDIEEDEGKILQDCLPNPTSIKELKVTRKYDGEYILSIPGVEIPISKISKIVEQMSNVTQQLEYILNKVSEKREDMVQEITECSQRLGEFKEAMNYPVQKEGITQVPSLSRAFEPLQAGSKSVVDSLAKIAEKGVETQEGEEAEEGGETEEGEGAGEGGETERVEEAEAQKLTNLHELEQELREFDDSISVLKALAEQYDELALTSIETVPKIRALIPEFIYVSAEHENLLRGEVNLDEIVSAGEDDIRSKSVLRLLKLAKLELSVLPGLTPIQRRRLLSDASNRITRVLQKVWGQQKVKVSLELAGPDERQLRIWISSDSGPDRFPEHQSYGFRWYLDFYLGYALASEKEAKDYVLLLDELGIHLHPYAQRNLVEVIREIAKQNQVIHTTHHIDMLDLENPERWRVVENNESNSTGTCIINEAYKPQEDHIGFEVIMKSLWGSTIVPSLIIGPRNLIVEGPSDIMFLGVISRILGKENEDNAVLVNGEIAVLQAGGLSYYRRMLTFCNRPGLNTVALFDSDETGRKTKRQLIEDSIIASNKAVEINDVYVSSATEERDLESIFNFNLLKEAAMNVYKADLAAGFNFKKDDLPNKGGLGRRFKDFFESQGIERYDKTKVAESLKSILLQELGRLPQNSRERFNDLIRIIRESFNS